MDRKEASISAEGLDKDSILSVCFSIFQQFSWQPVFAGEDKLMAVTAPEWNKKPQHITVTVTGGLLTVSSEFAGEELTDIVGRNRRNVDQFLASFQTLKNSLPLHKQQHNIQAINALRAHAATPPQLYKEPPRQVNATVEVKEDLNNDSDSSNLYATYSLITLNIIVFVLMALNGAGFVLTDGLIHLRWGSNFGPLTLSGEWWRLLSYAFIHFGIFHLAIDIYCLYWAGNYLEPLLGKTRYVIAYLCSAVLAGITSIWWHNPPINSAGAGGAIFGLDGVLLAFLSAGALPEELAKKMRRGLGFFLLLTLVIGLSRRVDSAAPAGGLLSGFIIGYIFILALKREKQGQTASWVSPLIFSLTAIFAAIYLQHFQVSPQENPVTKKETKSNGYTDNEKFNSAYQQYNTLAQKGLDVFNDNSITEAQRITDLGSISFTEWDSAEDLAREMKGYKASPEMHRLAATLEQYAQLRKQEIALYVKVYDKHASPRELEALRSKIKIVTDRLQ